MPRPRSLHASSTILVTSLALAALASAACGGGSDGEAFSDFLGTWRVDTTSTFSHSCAGTTEIVDPLWNELIFLPGTLSDLIESDCGLTFDVQGKKATLTATDPFTMSAAGCSFSLGQNADAIDVATVLPMASGWAFTLQAQTKGQAPTATLTGNGDWNEELISLADGSTLGSRMCTYVVNASLTKIAKH